MIIIPSNVSTVVPDPQLLTGITYTQSSVLPSRLEANYAAMNNGSAADLNRTTTGYNTTSWIRADCGSTLLIDRIVIGYDYSETFVDYWGTSYTENRNIQGSTNGTDWTTITTTPTYASSGSTNGLVAISIKQSWRYIRIVTASAGYVTLTEFQIWGIP